MTDVIASLKDATLEPVPFQALPRWSDDNHTQAFSVFLKTASTITTKHSSLRPARDYPASFIRLLDEAKRIAPDEARAFFESRFDVYFVRPDHGRGFLTGYYEPEIEAALHPSPSFPVPVLRRPSDLVTFSADDIPEAFRDCSLSAARQTGQGLVPYFDRAAIEDGALSDRALECLYLPDRVELFFAQIQGSARVRLQDGTSKRLVYAGRNGHPYTTIAKLIIAEGHMALEEITLESLKAWLRAHPRDADRLMRQNRSYIFFTVSDDPPLSEGPLGGASVSLTAGRSLAVDRHQWFYGLPFFIESTFPDGHGGIVDYARLMIAQDTGSAILGAARGDIFCGSGADAGRQAGMIRHPGNFFVLWPKG